MLVSRKAIIIVGICSALLGAAVSLAVFKYGSPHAHYLQLILALATLVTFIIVVGTVVYFQISFRRALKNQDEAQKIAKLGSWERNLTTGIGYWSDNRYRLFGMKPGRYAPTLDEFYSLLHPDDRERVRNTVSDAFKNSTHYEVQYRIANDAENRHFISRGTIIRDALGKAVSVVGTSQDITEKIEHEKQNAALIAQKDQFIARLGHDLNTPLTPLITLLPMVRKQLDDEKHIKRLDICIQSVTHLRDLVVSSMELAHHFQPLRHTLHFSTFSVSNLVDDVTNSLNDVLKSHSMVVRNIIAPEITIHADMDQIETVIKQILTNAIKFSSKGSEILCSASVENNCSVTISITDHGVGLSSEEITHIFDEFYKADSSRHELGSSGLGLAICRQIILNHGGLIRANSDGKGLGTTLSFTLLAGGAI